jgi:hypothetical protein
MADSLELIAFLPSEQIPFRHLGHTKTSSLRLCFAASHKIQVK